MNGALEGQVAGDSLAGYLEEAARLGWRAVAVLVFGLLPVLGWITVAPLASAVVGQAYVKVDMNRRPVQHSEGGLVREVLVRDGQRVKQGEALLVLGDVSVDADRNRLNYRVMTERASQARLEAERIQGRSVVFSPDVEASARQDPRLADQLARERSLFEIRRGALLGQVALLRAQREKVTQEIDALRAQITQAGESMQFQKNELETNRQLLKDGFIAANRLTQLNSSVSDYGVKLEERRSELARAEQRLVDTDLRIRSLEGDYRQQASDQLKVTAARLAEIEQEQRKSMDAWSRQVIVAPASGEVIDLKYASVGAVVPPRETIADIVPDNSRLVTEVRIRPEDINRIHLGQAADIRFTAFKYRTTKLVHGKVTHVSADRLVDRATNAPYYQLHIEAEPASLKEVGDLKLLAGMPAEVYILGEERTPLQYLLEPVTQVVRNAARER